MPKNQQRCNEENRTYLKDWKDDYVFIKHGNSLLFDL